MEFCNNEDVRRLFIFTREPKNTLVASLSPPAGLRTKAVFFLKTNQASKLTKDNVKTDVVYTDCDTTALAQLDLLAKEVCGFSKLSNETLTVMVYIFHHQIDLVV